MTPSFAKTYRFVMGDATHELMLFSEGDVHHARRGERAIELRVRPISENCLLLEIGRSSVTVYLAREEEKHYISIGGRQYQLLECGPAASEGSPVQTQAFLADQALASPMPGQVVKIGVSEGDVVEKNQTVAIVEAMKMENELRASGRSRVKKIYAADGDLVDAGQVIVELEPIASP